MKLIALSGLANSGKDTVADILVNDHRYVKISLADVMKRFVMDVWGVPEEHLWGPSHLRSSETVAIDPITGERATVRKILQNFGTEVGRNIDRDVWARYAMRTAKALMDPKHGGRLTYTSYFGLEEHQYCKDYPTGVVIPDVRFLNESDHIKAENGLLWRIKRPGSGLKGQFALHQSEQEMAAASDEYFNSVIENDGTMEELKNKVDYLVSKM